MSDSGLTLTQQPPLSSAAEATADRPAGELWHALAADGLVEHIESGVCEVVGDEPAGQRALALEERGVTALDGLFASAVAGLADADPIREERQEQARRLTTEFGAAERSAVGLHAPLSGLANGPLAVLEAADATPTVTVRLDGFESLRADQREDVVGLFADLAATCDFRIVASGFAQTKLRREYHEDLPGVSEPCNAPPSEGEVAARVETARETLDPDGREVSVLRSVAGEAGETLSYGVLFADAAASESRIRQCVGTLRNHDLVATFDGPGGRMVEVLAAGRRFLETVKTEIGVQQTVSECVSATPKDSDDSRVNPHAHEGSAPPGGGGGGAGAERSRFHQVRTASRHRAAAAAATAPQGGVAVADHPIPTKDDPEEPHRYYDSDADRLVVGGQYRNPLQWWVCVALALADTRTFRHGLTPGRLESGEIGDLLADHTDLLRRSRCLGHLADRDATGEGYRDALLAAAEDLRDLTRDLYHGNYEDRDRFRGEILRMAHGLAGTMAHLCDLADIEVVREARIPEFSRDFDADAKRDLATTIAKGATIQSRYRQFAAYRQLFETRDDKLDGAITPTVDADDPHGELIGSFVIVGNGVGEAFADRLRRRLGADETREDAPEFAVPIPVETADGTERRHHAVVARKLCSQKEISTTRAAVSILAALTGSPWDTAAALHNLAPETKAPTRRIRLDEVRFALSTLPTDRILPDMSKPALSNIVHALLTAAEPLSQTALAERADVSAQSIRNHADRLAVFGFIRQDCGGWRLELPFRGDGEHDERGEDIAPYFVATGNDHDATTATVRDILGDALADLLPTERYVDPDDPLGGALFAGPGEVIPALRAGCDWLDPWIDAVRTLLDADTGPSGPPTPPTATIGEPPTQTSINATAAAGGD